MNNVERYTPQPCPQPAEPLERQETVAQMEAELRAYRQAAEPALSGPSATSPASAVAEATGQACMSLAEANGLTAELAGFFPRKAYPHPGPKVLARGLLILGGLVRYERLKNAPPP